MKIETPDTPDTTRRHPRSLSDAFPDERAYVLERPPRKTHAARTAAILACIFALVVWSIVCVMNQLY